MSAGAASEAVFVGCTPGLESALAGELSSLGFIGREVSGGVEVETPPGGYRAINLYSRVASRVLVRVASVQRPEALAGVSLAPFGSAFTLEASGGLGRFRPGLERLAGAGGGPLLQARLDGGRCVLSVDTSGALLYQRGYRQEVGRAPLRETLAAGVLRLAGWAPGEALWDVMCGSGTLLIEAAEQALGLAAGRSRRFAFEAFPSHDEAAWRALPRAGAAVPTSLLGSDLNAGALGVARRNAARAGVGGAVSLERLDALELPPRAGPGLVVANLPYGKRVGARGELPELYRRLAESVKRALPGWRFAFLVATGGPQLRLPVSRRCAVQNGGLRCELLVGQV